MLFWNTRNRQLTRISPNSASMCAALMVVVNWVETFMGVYEKPDLKLCAIPKVKKMDRSDNFWCWLCRVADEGIPSTSGRSKPLLFFEGQPDHRLPVHDQSLWLTGTFKALGRIIGHSILHGVLVFMDYRQQ